MAVLIGIIIIIAIIAAVFDWIDSLIFFLNPYYLAVREFTGEYFFLFLAALFLILAVMAFFYFKPHPAQKYFLACSKGQITKKEAVEGIGVTMFNYRKDRVPSARRSKRTAVKIFWLKKRVKAEKELIIEICDFLKARSRLEDKNGRLPW